MSLSLQNSIVGQGFPFIWGHGLMMNMKFDDRVGWLDWTTISKSARLIRYDACGHGQSPPASSPDGYRWDRLGEDMISLAVEKGAESFIAGGQSMGSATALFAALLSPEKVKALVLVTPPTAWETRSAQAQNYQRMADRLQKKGIEGIIQLMAVNPAMPIWMYAAQPEKNKLSLEAVQGFDVDTLKNVLLGAGLSNLPNPERLSALKMPTLILAWSEDPGHPLSTAERLAEILPNSELVVANTLPDVAAWTPKIAAFVQKVAKE